MGGWAVLLNGGAVAGGGDLDTEFNAARDDEYEEIVDRCQDFLASIEKETAVRHFTYGELEENEEDLKKLRGWYEKVKARDALGASGAQQVEEILTRCAVAIEAFAANVYDADDSGH